MRREGESFQGHLVNISLFTGQKPGQQGVDRRHDLAGLDQTGQGAKKTAQALFGQIDEPVSVVTRQDLLDRLRVGHLGHEMADHAEAIGGGKIFDRIVLHQETVDAFIYKLRHPAFS